MISQHDKLISCDDHLDLNQLPADLWTARLPSNLRERAPHIEMRDGKAVWICNGRNWGSWAGHDAGDKGPKVAFNAFDRGGYTDPTERRAGVAELRLADMDRDGVEAHVIYGPVTSIKLDDSELRDACYRAYNDWLAEFCAVAPDRLIGVPMLPEDPESAVAELERIARMGIFKQANVQIAEAQVRLNDPRWTPFWSAIEDTGLLLSFHVVVFEQKKDDPARGKPAGWYTHSKSFVAQFIDPFVDLFAWAILENHPKLKIVIAESGAGWVPWLVEELDHRYGRLMEAQEYWATKGGVPFKQKPSDLFKRQVYATFQDSPTLMRLIEFYGDDNLLWASDYPHPDSVWPFSRETIERQMRGLPHETIRKLTYGNAAKLYGLDQSADQRETVPA